MAQREVPVVWSPTTRLHDPKREVWVGTTSDATEVAARVDAILESLRGDGHRLVEASPASDEVLETVHDPDLLAFLRTAADRWAAGPYAELVRSDEYRKWIASRRKGRE